MGSDILSMLALLQNQNEKQNDPMSLTPASNESDVAKARLKPAQIIEPDMRSANGIPNQGSSNPDVRLRVMQMIGQNLANTVKAFK